MYQNPFTPPFLKTRLYASSRSESEDCYYDDVEGIWVCRAGESPPEEPEEPYPEPYPEPDPDRPEEPTPERTPAPTEDWPPIPLPERQPPLKELFQAMGRDLLTLSQSSIPVPLELEPLQGYQQRYIQPSPEQYRPQPIDMQPVSTNTVQRAIARAERPNPLLQTQVISEEQVRQRARETMRAIAEVKGKDPARLERYIPDAPIEYVDPARVGPSLADILNPAREERPFQRRVNADYWRQYERPSQRGSVLDRMEAEQNAKLARQQQAFLEANRRVLELEAELAQEQLIRQRQEAYERQQVKRATQSRPKDPSIDVSQLAKQVAKEVLDFLILDDINTLRDPNAPWLDKGLVLASFFPVGKVVKGTKLLAKVVGKSDEVLDLLRKKGLTEKQIASYKKITKKIRGDLRDKTEIRVYDLPNQGKAFEYKLPGNNRHSHTMWEKYIDQFGNSTIVGHRTYNTRGDFIHWHEKKPYNGLELLSEQQYFTRIQQILKNNGMK